MTIASIIEPNGHTFPDIHKNYFPPTPDGKNIHHPWTIGWSPTWRKKI